MPHAFSCPTGRFRLIHSRILLWHNNWVPAPRFLAVIWPPGWVDCWCGRRQGRSVRRQSGPSSVGNQIYLICRDTMMVGWWFGDLKCVINKRNTTNCDDPQGLEENKKIRHCCNPNYLWAHGQRVNFKFCCRISRVTFVFNTARDVWVHSQPIPQDNSTVVPRCMDENDNRMHSGLQHAIATRTS